MGFKRRSYRLRFDDPTLDGLEVLCRGASIEELARFSDWASLGEQLLSGDGDSARQDMYEALAGKVISWNLVEDDDTPIAVSPRALAETDANVVLSILFGWIDAVAGVPRPLGRTSSAGEPSVEVSIPMDVL